MKLLVYSTKCTYQFLLTGGQECAPAISKGASLATVSGIELKASQHAWLDTDSLILALRSGQLVSVHLKTDGSKVISIQVRNKSNWGITWLVGTDPNDACEGLKFRVTKKHRMWIVRQTIPGHRFWISPACMWSLLCVTFQFTL